MVAEKKTAAKKPAPEKKAPRAPAPKKEAAAAQVDGRNALQKRREVTGLVTSDKMQKTIVVKVDRRVRHKLYQKYLTHSVSYKAHDEKNDAKVGDLVVLAESRPLSRDKRWALVKILRRGGQAPEANV